MTKLGVFQQLQRYQRSHNVKTKEDNLQEKHQIPSWRFYDSNHKSTNLSYISACNFNRIWWEINLQKLPMLVKRPNSNARISTDTFLKPTRSFEQRLERSWRRARRSLYCSVFASLSKVLERLTDIWKRKENTVVESHKWNSTSFVPKISQQYMQEWLEKSKLT